MDKATNGVNEDGARYYRPTNWTGRLHRWGWVLVSRILGTRTAEDQQCKGMRDLITKCLLLRAEVNALTGLLADKGVFTAEEWTARLQAEAKWLCEQYEQQFPGARATDTGMDIYDVKLYAETAKGWPA
jgi:hypothetical protein